MPLTPQRNFAPGARSTAGLAMRARVPRVCGRCGSFMQDDGRWVRVEKGCQKSIVKKSARKEATGAQEPVCRRRANKNQYNTISLRP